MSREIVVGLHFYQPPRQATHPDLEKISTDPHQKNWSQIIDGECYRPLSNKDTLKNISFDLYQVLLNQLQDFDPNTAKEYIKALKENGIGDPYIHPILPDLSREDKNIVMAAGKNRFKELTGTNPRYFWPPETAIDTETLEVLHENDYHGFICAPEQVIQPDGKPSDNQPTIIDLGQGKQLIALPFDRPISSRLAFDPKINADFFTEHFIKNRTDNLNQNQFPIAWTDAETFGHHWPKADIFLNYLLNQSLPNKNLTPISINELNLNVNHLPVGKIVERSAWSCSHGNLVRWSGSCDCSWDGDSRWKQPLYQAYDYLNNSVTEIVKVQLGDQYQEEIISNFHHLYQNNKELSPKENLIKAKISAMVCKTSCATFFSHPDVSNNINLLYAYQTLLYLSESGLTNETVKISTKFYELLNNVPYPYTQDTALNALNKLLNQT